MMDGWRPLITYSALVTRLMTTCWSSCPRPSTGGADWSSPVRNSTFSTRSTRCRISATSRTRSLIWTRVGVVSARRARRSRLRTMRAAVSPRLGDEDAAVPRLPDPRPREDEVERDLAGRQPEGLEVEAQRLRFGGDAEEPTPGLVHLQDAALPVDQRQRQRARVHHGMRPLRRRTRARHGFGQLEPARDVRRDRREV